MKVLVTGHEGYIGHILVPMLQDAGHEVHGLDTNLFVGCGFDWGTKPLEIPSLRVDVRDVEPDHLRGFDAVLHLAAVSNDPIGHLNPDTTYAINERGSVHMAKVAKEAGVERFLFSSSCSLYGAAEDDTPLTEEAAFNPVTPYGESKVKAEQAIMPLVDDDFTASYLRNATAYGYSPRMRGDIVVNNLTGYAMTTGKVKLLSDGTPWRPLVHVADISQAFLRILEAPRELVHNQAYNVGSTAENYMIRDVAKVVAEVVEGSELSIPEPDPTAEPDKRSYRVSFEKIATHFPDFHPQWTVRRGAEEVYEAYQRQGFDEARFEGPDFIRLKQVMKLIDAGTIDSSLRFT